MCEVGVFPIFLGNDLLKVDKILGLTFFKARKDLEGFNTAFFNLRYSSWVLCSMDCLQLPCIRVEEGSKIEVYLWQTNLKGNFCRNSTFQVNRKKNDTGRRRLTSSNRSAIFVSTSCKLNDTTNPFGYKLGESTENTKALLFFSGEETVRTFSGSI